MGSCRGHSTSTCFELGYQNQVKQSQQFSRMFSYLTGQKIDGLLGRDAGSTISGGIQAGMKYGICREDTFPYPGVYTTQVPANAYTESTNFKIKSFTKLVDYDSILAFLAGKMGGVSIGVLWNESWNRPVLERVSLQGGGGHAVSLVGWSERRDLKGRPYLWLLNSHGEDYANKGWAEVAPAVIEQVAEHRFTEAIGISDLETLDKPRAKYSDFL